jgi:hypothetical protein
MPEEVTYLAHSIYYHQNTFRLAMRCVNPAETVTACTAPTQLAIFVVEGGLWHTCIHRDAEFLTEFHKQRTNRAINVGLRKSCSLRSCHTFPLVSESLAVQVASAVHAIRCLLDRCHELGTAEVTRERGTIRSVHVFTCVCVACTLVCCARVRFRGYWRCMQGSTI